MYIWVGEWEGGEQKWKKKQFLFIIISEPREEDGHGNKHSPMVSEKD